MPGPIIRPATTAEDWRAVRALCCATGDAGDPIASPRWPFFAEVWIGPYERLRADWTYVAEVDGQLVGYLTGCPDTPAFERARRWAVTLPLLGRLASGRYRWSGDARRYVRQAVGLAVAPERRFPAALRRRLGVDYPAHLHMNVAAAARRRGIGAALLGRYVGDLAARGVPGVHLICGAGPLLFYARAGFEELGSVAMPSGVPVFALGRRLGGDAMGDAPLRPQPGGGPETRDHRE